MPRIRGEEKEIMPGEVRHGPFSLKSSPGGPRVGIGSSATRFTQLMRNSSRLATESLAHWYGCEIAVESLDLVVAASDEEPVYDILQACGRQPSQVLADFLRIEKPMLLQHRYVRMSIPRGMVGVANSTVVLDRLEAEERFSLIETGGSLGRVLQVRGIRRETLHINGIYDNRKDIVSIQALLCRGTLALGYVQETFYSEPVECCVR